VGAAPALEPYLVYSAAPDLPDSVVLNPWPVQSTAPTSHYTGWADSTTTPPTPKYWNGSAWVAIGGSGGGGIFETDTFTGDGTTKAFTTSATPNGAVAVFYRPSAGDSFQRYDPSLVTVTGTTVTLTDSPIASSTILIDYTHS
jgi:hypothetical protein